MKIILFSLFSLCIISCSTKNSSQEQKVTTAEVSEPIQKEEPLVKEEDQTLPASKQDDDAKYNELDSTIRDDLKILDKTYGATPFYMSLNNRNFYIIATEKYKYPTKRFDGTLKYGLANDSLEIMLDPIYDKIYNPNTALLQCFELKKNAKIGLFNYQTGEVLEPQFDYLLPSKNTVNNTAYGFKDQQWFEIRNTAITRSKEINYDPSSILKNLAFSILTIGENMMFDSYYQFYEYDANQGKGVVIVPSYVEYFNLLSDEAYLDVILPDQAGRIDFGTTEAKLSTSSEQRITDRIISFFVSIYESGIDARGYNMEATELLVYNKESNMIDAVPLGGLSESDYFCRESAYRFLNDSIIEVKSNISKYATQHQQRYDFETKFNYYGLSKNGQITELTSNRYYDFTKYIFIDESNLKGCFARRMKNIFHDEDFNMWMTDHLSIADLDLMRNEIFAEYGYRFKTEQWKNYFSAKPWYKPLHDDVNEKLTEIDKANIKFILEVKEKMIGREDEFINKHKGHYVAAG